MQQLFTDAKRILAPDLVEYKINKITRKASLTFPRQLSEAEEKTLKSAFGEANVGILSFVEDKRPYTIVCLEGDIALSRLGKIKGWKLASREDPFTKNRFNDDDFKQR